MSVKAIQLLSRRAHHFKINNIHNHSRRLFTNCRYQWHRRLHSFDGHKRMQNKMNMMNRFGQRWHWGHHAPKVIYRFGYTIGFGSSLSMVISYTHYKSIVWACVHGVFSWIYVIYFALEGYNQQEKSAKELMSVQVDELSKEVERLNDIYKKFRRINTEPKDEQISFHSDNNFAVIQAKNDTQKLRKEIQILQKQLQNKDDDLSD